MRRSDEDLERPLTLVSVPATVALVIALLVIAGGALWLFGGHVAVQVPATGVIVNPPENVEVVTAIDGTLEGATSQLGDRVVKGSAVGRVRTPAGKLVPVVAPITGTVVSEDSGAYAAVKQGQSIVTLAHDAVPMIALVFAPTNTIPGISTGDPVILKPVSADPPSEGTLSGRVEEVTRLPVDPPRVQALVADPALAEELAASGTIHQITIVLDTQPGSPANLLWTGGPGPALPPTSGEIVQAEIVIAEETPWQALIGGDQ